MASACPSSSTLGDAVRGRHQEIVAEHFVAHQRETARCTERVQFAGLAAREDRACGVVRADGQHGTRARIRDGPELVHVQRPPAVVLEPVRADGDAVQSREVLEQRVAWSRHEHRIARIAQQLEQQRVAVAAACREDDPTRRHSNRSPRVICGDRLARTVEAERLRLVAQRSRIGEAVEQIQRVVESARRRIGCRQIDQRHASARKSETTRVSGLGSRSGGKAMGEHFAPNAQ